MKISFLQKYIIQNTSIVPTHRTPVSVFIYLLFRFFSKIKILIIQFSLKNLIYFLIPKDQKSISYWKEYFFNIIFFLVILINSIVFIASSVRHITNGNYRFLIISVVLFIFSTFIVYAKKIPFKVRSQLGCFIFYFVGLSIFSNIGPNSGGLFWFFLFSILTAFFNGISGVVIANTIIGMTVVFFSFLIPRYDFNWMFITSDFYSSNTWWLTGVNLFVLSVISSTAVALFMNNLERALLINIDSKNAIIIGLASLAEYRDEDTGKHLERISRYVILLTKELKKKEQFKDYISENYIEDLSLSSILHDIGKVGIEDKILLKHGKLTSDEFEIIKRHTTIGSKVIENIRKKMKDQDFLKLANQIILYHHEKFDGTGYPSGLKGEEIPLSARIVSLVDVYDALTSQRVYKEAFSHEKSLEIIQSQKGLQFDPDIIDIFISIHTEFNNIRRTVIG
jgi:HD-GYP domain-containing protein (c-di-GMP phosphodiesterase class II)